MCNYFLAHTFKHMFWVLKRTVSMRRSFEYPQHVLVEKKETYFWYALLTKGLYQKRHHKQLYSAPAVKNLKSNHSSPCAVASTSSRSTLPDITRHISNSFLWIGIRKALLFYSAFIGTSIVSINRWTSN